MGNVLLLTEESDSKTLRANFSEGDRGFHDDGRGLPYEQLGGAGFERLCYLMLLHENRQCLPHFFGRQGQADYGVDLTAGDTVYQCKNWARDKRPTMGEFKEIFTDFYHRWIREQGLPCPARFILFTAAVLDRDSTSHRAFLQAKESFEQILSQEGQPPVEVDFKDRTHLDERLRHLPDIVTDLFGDDMAMRHCHELTDWEHDLFIPVRPGEESKFLKDYFSRQDKLYIPQERQQDVYDTMRDHKSMLIKGNPGSGKTTLCLDLASRFSALAGRARPHHVYYLNFKSQPGLEALKRGIRRRSAVPTIFIFDDCQRSLEVVKTLNYSITSLIEDKEIFCLYIYRTTLTEEEERDEDVEFFDFFDEATLDIKTDPCLFEQITARIRPALRSISPNQIYHLAGGDLWILDFMLRSLGTVKDFEGLKQDRHTLYERIIEVYFNTRTGRFDGVLRLAAAAQFDIGICPDYYQGILRDMVKPDRRPLVEELVVEAGRPSRCYFLHSSLAELTGRAAAYVGGADFITTTAANIVDYFRHQASSPHASAEDFNRALGQFIYNRLKLPVDEEEDNRIKQQALAHEDFFLLCRDRFDHIHPNIIGMILQILRRLKDSNPYLDLLKNKIEAGTYINALISCENVSIGPFLHSLKIDYPEGIDHLKKQLDAEKIKTLCQRWNLPSLVFILSNLFNSQDGSIVTTLLDNVNSEDIDRIIDNTINRKTSIGTINLRLRRLKETCLLEKLEQKIGAENYIKLILSNGTLVELVNILRHLNPSTAAQIIDALSGETGERIIQKTIAENRSIDTIRWGFGHLKRLRGQLLEKLEDKIGVHHFIELILGSGNPGTLPDLLESLTNKTKEKIVERLNSLSRGEKEAFVLKGHFYNTCFAVSRGPGLRLLSGQESGKPGLDRDLIWTLMEKSDFESLNKGLRTLKDCTDDDLRSYLSELMGQFVSYIDMQKIDSASAAEKINYLFLLYQLKRLDTADLQAVVNTIDDEELLKEKNLFPLLRLLMLLLTIYPVGPGLRQEVLHLGNGDKIVKKIEKENPLNLFLHLWNTYALFKAESTEEFCQWLNPEVLSGIFQVIRQKPRPRPKTDDSNNLLKLVGLLDYLKIDIEALRDLLPHASRFNLSKTFLTGVLEQLPFIPGFFFLKGLEFVIRRPIYPHFWQQLTPKIDDYPVRTKALNELFKNLESRIPPFPSL